MENKKVEIDLADLVRVCNILDSLRVSLDSIGAIGGAQGRDKMRLAMDEFFTGEPSVYREIADNWLMLAQLMKKEVGWDEFLNLTRTKKIPYFELKEH